MKLLITLLKIKRENIELKNKLCKIKAYVIKMNKKEDEYGYLHGNKTDIIKLEDILNAEK